MDFDNKSHPRNDGFFYLRVFYVQNLTLLQMLIEPAGVFPGWMLSEGLGEGLDPATGSGHGDKNDRSHFTQGVSS
jgi:hypothetical protein